MANAATLRGRTLFVTGASPYWYAYATLAYDAVSGAPLWEQSYSGPGHQSDDNIPTAVAPSPDGSSVFVTGYSDGGSGNLDDYATVSYNLVSGAHLCHWKNSVDDWTNRAARQQRHNLLGKQPRGSCFFLRRTYAQ